MKVRFVLALLVLAALAACSSENRYEREARRITQAVMNDDLRPVQNDLAPDTGITRVDVAEWSDELDEQGKLLSVKEITPCPVAGAHCFDVRFEKHDYQEMMLLDDRGKVVQWYFRMVQPGAAGSPAP